MKKIEVYSRKLDTTVTVETDEQGLIVILQDFLPVLWQEEGWNNSSEGWQNEGWNNSSGGWTNEGWNNSSEGWQNEGWNNSSGGWTNEGWNNS